MNNHDKGYGTAGGKQKPTVLNKGMTRLHASLESSSGRVSKRRKEAREAGASSSGG